MMADDNPIKLFQSVQKFYQTMGILPIKSSSLSTSEWNSKFLFFLLSMTLLLGSVTSFLLLEVTNMKDFGMAFYGTVTDLNIVIDFVITVWQMPTIFKLIRFCENFIEHSKFLLRLLSVVWMNFEQKKIRNFHPVLYIMIPFENRVHRNWKAPRHTDHVQRIECKNRTIV